jgi:hypothetical protein
MTELEAAILDKKYNQKVLDLCVRFHKGEKGKIPFIYKAFNDAVDDLILQVTGRKIAEDINDLEDIKTLITFRTALGMAIFEDDAKERDWKNVNVSEIAEAKETVLAKSLEIDSVIKKGERMIKKIESLNRKLITTRIIIVMLVLEIVYFVFLR